jgi:S1-C subfamily serine protease
VIALDASVDPATSGAPVVNAAGDVLGMITLAAPPGSGRPGDRSFAVSVDVARQAVFAIVDRV